MALKAVCSTEQFKAQWFLQTPPRAQAVLLGRAVAQCSPMDTTNQVLPLQPARSFPSPAPSSITLYSLGPSRQAGGSPAPAHTCRPDDPTVSNWKFLLLPFFKHTHAYFTGTVSEFPFLTFPCDHENIFVRRYRSFWKQTDGFQWNNSPENKPPVLQRTRAGLCNNSHISAYEDTQMQLSYQQQPQSSANTSAATFRRPRGTQQAVTCVTSQPGQVGIISLRWKIYIWIMSDRNCTKLSK